MKNNEKITELKGANRDIDLLDNKKVDWKKDKCPWNESKRCVIKNISLCKYFKGIKYPNKVLCTFSK